MLQRQSLFQEIAHLGPPNPFPTLPAASPDMEVPTGEGLLERDYAGLGRGVVPRGGCYPTYELYNRKLEERELPAIVLENRHLKAVFLPSLGGRLISLYSRAEEKELLFRNDKIYFGNLAICNAWFSGGIEWNVGKRGHACYTVSPVFMARVSHGGAMEDVEDEGLRIFDFERETGLFWQIDFFLACKAPLLVSRARIVNPHARDVPLYCWINTALPRRAETRVLSSTADVLYMDHGIKGLSRGRMPCPLKDHGDVSYVRNNVKSANEYFFQPEKGPYWEAVADEEGGLFFDCSSRGLPYRKAFIWGGAQGGRNWRRMLSASESPEYLEVQAGVPPSQFHSVPLEAGGEISWVQIFGSVNAEAGALHGEWASACGYAEGEIARELGRASLPGLENMDEMNRVFEEAGRRAPAEVLFLASGWGHLEYLRLGSPKSLRSFGFSSRFPGGAQRPWLELLGGRRLPRDVSLGTGMVERFWYDAIVSSIPKGGAGEEGFDEATAAELFHMGLTALAFGDDFLGESHLVASLERGRNPECAWLLMELCMSRNEYAGAARYGELLQGMPLTEWGQGVMASARFLTVLEKGGAYKRATGFFCNLPDGLRDHPKITWAYAPVALKNGELDWLERFFQQGIPYLREGEGVIVDLWEGYEAARGSGRPLPSYLDLRVFT